MCLSSLFSYPEQDRRYWCQFYPSQTQCTATVPAVHCNRPRSALHPPLQCTASARTYLVYFKRKYMRPPRITFATADANVINRGCKRYKPLPQTFAGKPSFSICLCKYVHLSLQVRATVLASTCDRPCKYVRPPLQVLAGKDAIIYESIPLCFSTEPVLPISDTVHCNRLCSALHPFTLIHATFPATHLLGNSFSYVIFSL